MKTTIDIPDALLEEARRRASREGITLKDLVGEGLRRALAERRSAGPFRLRKATFKGKGLRPHMAGAGWERIREAAYEERGG